MVRQAGDWKGRHGLIFFFPSFIPVASHLACLIILQPGVSSSLSREGTMQETVRWISQQDVFAHATDLRCMMK